MTRAELDNLMNGLAPVLREFSGAVTARLAVLEEKSATVGQPGSAGPPGRDGRDGQPGVMGIPGLDGKDGNNGRDGFSPEDFDFAFDPETRHLTLTFLRAGETPRVITKKLPGIAIYRGLWQAGTTYERGDQVTWDGAQWTSLQTTTAKPGIKDGLSDSPSRAWQLSVKRGDAGPKGPEGKPGRDGRDLTSMDSTGRKWGK